MIIWLNGTFGAGKTTTAQALVEQLPDAHLFDPEMVGQFLRFVLPGEVYSDFQDLPPWRPLVAETAAQLLAYRGGRLVVPMSLLREPYAKEIFTGLAGRGVKVRHILLHCGRDELVRRIETDEVETGARAWRLRHLAAYDAALPWLREAAEVIDTSDLPAAEVAAFIAGS
ncbi:AAA family ATPase [Nonomuraea sp. NBC_01738]|uniref:AAA family ATPase n=1 Tax=Nonomuraea sp. NBC_01738 TaxID=2976003 RepID=UPI002E128CC8|nr:AAA family ATPase [Nonomuraea sp. NBC_01738]